MDPKERFIFQIATSLSAIDAKAREKDVSKEKYIAYGLKISNILRDLSYKFGNELMVEIFSRTCFYLNHTLGPLDRDMIDQLVSAGCKIIDMNPIHA